MRTACLCTLLAASLLLTACGRHIYTQPGRSAADEERDYNECAYEAAKATGNLAKDSQRDSRIDDIVEKCMKAKGYK